MNLVWTFLAIVGFSTTAFFVGRADGAVKTLSVVNETIKERACQNSFSDNSIKYNYCMKNLNVEALDLIDLHINRDGQFFKETPPEITELDVLRAMVNLGK